MNWTMPVEFTCKMLNLFVGAGHMNYVNNVSLCLHILLNLHIDRPWLFEKLCNGFHSIRCTDRFLVGLWSDLVIEQFMMRSMKYRREFTRGRGQMGKNTCDLWVGTRHKCGEVHHAMQLVTRQHHQSNEYVEMNTPHSERDNSCAKLRNELLQKCDSILDDSRLHCITTGVAAG